MAAKVNVEELQAHFEGSLATVGYTGSVGRLPVTLEANEKLINFLVWLTEVVQPANHLSSDELRRYEELKSSGSILEGEVLENAYSQLDVKGQSTDEVAMEVQELKSQVSSLKSQLQTLGAVQKELTDHYASVTREKDELTRQKSQCQRHLHEAMQSAYDSNTKLNSALQELTSTTQDVCEFHRVKPKEGPLPQTTPIKFLSSVPLDEYQKSEDRYLAELTNYTKKQFFQGIASLAQTSSEDDGGGESGDVDLSDTEQVLLRGVSQEEHQRHCHELGRLQAIYPLTEVQYINAHISEQQSLAACKQAEEEREVLTQALRQGTTQLTDHNTLQHQIKEKQAQVGDLKTQITEVSHTRLPTLLQDMAALQVTQVLHGDYDLKIARQNYFTSKQNKVILHLQSQHARQELLSMLYEVELRRHRETHRLFSATEKHLLQWKEDREKRMEGMKSPAFQVVRSQKQTIDSRDKSSQHLCALLGIQPSASAPLITHTHLVSSVKQLCQQLATLEAMLSSHSSQLRQLVSDQELLTGEFEEHLFGSSHETVPSRPLLTIKEYEEECSKLKVVMSSLEQNIKTLLKDYNSKKKIIQGNPLIETERLLFVHFFTDPTRLNQLVTELARRVDALAAAVSSKQ